MAPDPLILGHGVGHFTSAPRFRITGAFSRRRRPGLAPLQTVRSASPRGLGQASDVGRHVIPLAVYVLSDGQCRPDSRSDTRQHAGLSRAKLAVACGSATCLAGGPHVSRREIMASPGSLLWAPVQSMWAGHTARINDCGPGRVLYGEPAAQLVRAASATRGRIGQVSKPTRPGEHRMPVSVRPGRRE